MVVMMTMMMVVVDLLGVSVLALLFALLFALQLRPLGVVGCRGVSS